MLHKYYNLVISTIQAATFTLFSIFSFASTDFLAILIILVKVFKFYMQFYDLLILLNKLLVK